MIEEALTQVLNWSEVWALVIPLLLLRLNNKQPTFFKPIIVYLWIAFLLNIVIDIIAEFRLKWDFPSWLQSNNPLYNLHSIVRFTCFSYYFLKLKQPFYTRFKKLIPVISLTFIVINFIFSENLFNPENLSGNLLSIEAYFLLIFCMLYYLSQLKDEVQTITSGPDFWVTTGLSIYFTINFFVFLFYVPMIKQNPVLADRMWNVHNVAYIILCFFIAKAFYAPIRS